MEIIAHLQRKPRFEPINYKLEDGTVITGDAVVIPAVIKTISNNSRLMKNAKQTPFRIATVQTFNPQTKVMETKPAQLIEALYNATTDSFAIGSEVEVMLQKDATSGKTYGKVQLPALESFDFTAYAPAKAEAPAEVN